jgi:hypothetical protein
MKPRTNAWEVARTLGEQAWIRWVSPTYGPYPIVAYAQAKSHDELVQRIEELRADTNVVELDARMCKHIPGDEDLEPLVVSSPEVAVLLINVDLTREKERIVAYNLRKMAAVQLARAMWGPTDIIAVVEEDEHESMRDLICDHVKTMNGVASNMTLYCYPRRK